MLSNLVTQLGAVLIPLGATLTLFSLQFLNGWKMFVCTILSFLVFGAGCWVFRQAINATRMEDKAESAKFAMLASLIEETNNEIKGLRQDLRNRGNENGEQTKSKSDDIEPKP